MRIKSKWHNQRVKNINDIASVVGSSIWKISRSGVDKLYNDGFNFSTNQQLLDVVAEFSGLLLQASADIAHKRLQEDDFQKMVSFAAKQLADIFSENYLEEEGRSDNPTDWRTQYIDKINVRLSAYAEFNFNDGDPSYPALRYFGSEVESCMLSGEIKNKWVIEQVMEVEAPVMLKKLVKMLNELLDQYLDSPEPVKAQ